VAGPTSVPGLQTKPIIDLQAVSATTLPRSSPVISPMAG